MHFFQVVKHKNNKQNIYIDIYIYIHIYISINAYALNRHRTRPVWTSLSRVVECGIVCVYVRGCGYNRMRMHIQVLLVMLYSTSSCMQIMTTIQRLVVNGQRTNQLFAHTHTHTHPRPFDCPPPDHLFSCLATNYGDTKRKEALQNVQVLKRKRTPFWAFQHKILCITNLWVPKIGAFLLRPLSMKPKKKMKIQIKGNT